MFWQNSRQFQGVRTPMLKHTTIVIFAVKFKNVKSHKLWLKCNMLVISLRVSSLQTKHRIVFLIHYGSCPVNISHLVVKIIKYIQRSHKIQYVV